MHVLATTEQNSMRNTSFWGHDATKVLVQMLLLVVPHEFIIFAHESQVVSENSDRHVPSSCMTDWQKGPILSNTIEQNDPGSISVVVGETGGSVVVVTNKKSSVTALPSDVDRELLTERDSSRNSTSGKLKSSTVASK